MFDENSKIIEILKSEQGERVLAENGVPCASCASASICGVAAKEMNSLTIGEVADEYGLDKKKIIEELNKE